MENKRELNNSNKLRINKTKLTNIKETLDAQITSLSTTLLLLYTPCRFRYVAGAN